MNPMIQKIHEVCTPEVIAQIIENTRAAIVANYRSLSAKAQTMADAGTYMDLIDYCFENVEAYVDNPDNMMKILTDSYNIQPAYNSIAETEEFKEICSEEYKGFPRIILMTVLAGSLAACANEAYLLCKDKDPQTAGYFDSLVDVYHKYLQDALSYGKGDDKKVVMTGQRQ